MARVNVTFYLDGERIIIQCAREDKMKDVCQKFSQKSGKDINSLTFFYDENHLNLEKSFQNVVNPIDNNNNEMLIIVHSNEKKGFICSKCGENIILNNKIIDDIMLSNNKIRNTINGIKFQLENIIKNSLINSINIQINNIKIILQTINEDIKKNNENLEKLFKSNNLINKNLKNNNNIIINNQIPNKDNIKFNPNINIADSQNSNLKEFINIADLFFYKSKIFDLNGFDYYFEPFSNFYSKLFEFADTESIKLFTEETYFAILSLSNKIFYLAKNKRILNNAYFYNSKREYLLISEFNFIIQVMEKYGKTSKKMIEDILIIFNKLYKNIEINNEINNRYIEDMNNLFDIIKENIPKDNYNFIIVEIFLWEYEKFKGRDILGFFFDNKHSYLFEDFIPIIENIFHLEIESKLNWNKRKNNNFLEFFSSEFFEVNKALEKGDNSFKEMILFYFESKIMEKMNIIFEEEKFDLNYLTDYFLFCLQFHDKEYDNSQIFSLYFSIAFIKCFIYKLIKYAYNLPEYIDPYIFRDKIFYAIKKNKLGHTLKMYIFKLIYHFCGNLKYFFKYNFNNLYFDGIEKEYFLKCNKVYGFDSLFIPLKLKTKDDMYNSIIIKLFNNEPIDIIHDKEINEAIKNNIDLLFCILVNFKFSFYIYKEYLYYDDEIEKWILDKIDEKEIDAIKDKKEILKIFFYFIKPNENNIYQKYKILSYDQLLCLLISARFVINTISAENKDNLFYNLLFDAKNTIKNNQIIFNEYYLKDFDMNIIDKRKINCLSYKLINYIILSHLCFGYELKSLPNDYLDNLFKEFNFIKNYLLPLLGINNAIIFMNEVFKELYHILINIKCNNNENYIKNNEILIDISIKNIIARYKKSVDDYFLYKNDNLIDILLENPKFYNSKSTENDYPLLTYFTQTNFLSLNDDFKLQFIYFNYNSSDYPFLSAIFSEEKIFDLIDYLPKLNEFSNLIYYKLNMKYSQKELQKKEITKEFNTELNRYINDFNSFIEKNNQSLGINKIIYNNTNLYEILNLPGSLINLVYNKIIQLYNNFLKKMKICTTKDKIMEEVIIQEAREDDYNFNYVTYKGKRITIKEKLKELILLYSKRERIINNNINVYNGGRIIYNFELIESKLEEQFIFGKKYFSEKQKMFISSKDLFKDEFNILKEFEKKFPQKKNNIGYDKTKFEEIIEKMYQINKLNAFYELYFLFKYVAQKDFDLDKKINIKDIIDIIKYLEMKAYKLPQLKEMIKLSNNNLDLKNIILLYEIIKNQVFDKINSVNKLEVIDKIDLTGEEQNNIMKCLKTNKIITLDVLISAMKKYILRYFKDKDKRIFNLNDLSKKKDIWDKNIFGTEKFIEEFNKLCAIDSKGRNIIFSFCYTKIFEININFDEDEFIEDIEEDLLA